MSGDAECQHCGRLGAEAWSGPGIHARQGTPLCHPSDASLPDCYRRVSVWAEPVGALLHDGPKPAGVESIVSAEEHAKAYREWRASFPHDPMWNLIPRRLGMGPWECSWHGTVGGDRCGECHREHAEYLEAGTWEDRR